MVLFENRIYFHIEYLFKTSLSFLMLRMINWCDVIDPKKVFIFSKSWDSPRYDRVVWQSFTKEMLKL